MNTQLAEAEETTANTHAQKKKVEQECEGLKRQVNEKELALKKAEADKTTKENQV